MIRFGLLGCGRIAKRHSDLLGGNHIAGAKLVAVCDPVRARADAVAVELAALRRERRIRSPWAEAERLAGRGGEVGF